MSDARRAGHRPIGTGARSGRLSLLVVALAAALAWLAWPRDHATPTLPPAPPLRDAVAGCSGPADVSRHRALQASAAARGAIMRYPFAPAEGPRAVALLAEASACHSEAGAVADAARLQARRASWLTRLRDDYRDHRLRLTRALAAGDDLQALRALRAIEALLPPGRDAYRDALGRLALELEGRTSGRPR